MEQLGCCGVTVQVEEKLRGGAQTNLAFLCVCQKEATLWTNA
jgi:hypothetical protein